MHNCMDKYVNFEDVAKMQCQGSPVHQNLMYAWLYKDMAKAKLHLKGWGGVFAPLDKLLPLAFKSKFKLKSQIRK